MNTLLRDQQEIAFESIASFESSTNLIHEVTLSMEGYGEHPN